MPDRLARACKGIRQPEAMQEGVAARVRLCGLMPPCGVMKAPTGA